MHLKNIFYTKSNTLPLKKVQLDFLKKLCDSFGPSGFEREPARITKNYVRQFTKDIQADKLGSVFFKKKGQKLAGHPGQRPPGR